VRVEADRGALLQNRSWLEDKTAWNRSNRRAGKPGGARVGRPRWVRILRITGGSSIAAMIFKLPPQFGQWSMSKTRLSSLAQLMRAGAPCT